MNTASAGSSLGGLVSYYAVLKYQNVFEEAPFFRIIWFTNDYIHLTENTKN